MPERLIQDQSAKPETEIVLEAIEGELDGGYPAGAVDLGVHTQGDAMSHIRRNVTKAMEGYFDDDMVRQRLILLNLVREGVLAS